MEIIKALPITKYAAAYSHAQTRGFLERRDSAIQAIREAVRHPQINHLYPAAAWGGYGKDSCAIMILLKLAGVEWVALSVFNGGDLPVHEAYCPEFDRFLGDHRHTIYRTERRYVDYLVEARRFGRNNGMTKKNGSLIDYWELGAMDDYVNWNIDGQFSDLYASGESDILMLYGNRKAEEQWKNNEFIRRKDQSLFRVESKGGLPYWDLEPLMGWRDIDVWALLISEGAPCSPIYSMHQVPQRVGKNAFPRTLWYPSSFLMNATYYKWLAFYAPALLDELNRLFPELPAKMKAPVAV